MVMVLDVNDGALLLDVDWMWRMVLLDNDDGAGCG
jgi:hypothetical protein